MLAGDGLQIAVLDDERRERVVVEEKGIAVLERVFGSFGEKLSGDLESGEVFQLHGIEFAEMYSIGFERMERIAHGCGHFEFVVLKLV